MMQVLHSGEEMKRNKDLISLTSKLRFFGDTSVEVVIALHKGFSLGIDL